MSILSFHGQLMRSTAGSLLCLSHLQFTQRSLMYVVRVISCCKEAMTTNCFPLLLSSSFRPLLVFLFPVPPAALSLRSGSSLRPWALACRAEGQLWRSGCLRHPRGSWVAHPACRASRSDSSRGQLQLALLAGVLGLGSSEASLPQDFYCHLFCCL